MSAYEKWIEQQQAQLTELQIRNAALEAQDAELTKLQQDKAELLAVLKEATGILSTFEYIMPDGNPVSFPVLDRARAVIAGMEAE